MLLNKILLSMNEGNLVSYDDLAEKLNVDLSVINAGVYHLYTMGYLQKYSNDCTKCSNCKDVDSKINIWMLTEKGKRYIEKIVSL